MSSDEIPAEVYRAGRGAFGSGWSLTGHKVHAVVEAIWPLAYAAGRQSIYDGWAAKLAEDAVPDDPEALRARVRREARALVEDEIRAEVAAELRATFAAANSAVPPFLQAGAKPRGRDIAEWAARIAEGGAR